MIWGFPNPEGDVNILVSMRLKGPKPSFEYFRNRPDEFQQHIHDIFPETKTLMPHLVDDLKSFGVSRLITKKCFPWSFGKFMLMGDAAHSMNPFTGQGFNTCIESTVQLMEALDRNREDWDKAIDEFQTLRKI
jgi:kynurenine 3-monooxygenase